MLHIEGGNRANPGPEYHQVLCCLTRAQYEQLLKDHDTGPSGPVHPPMLFINTTENGEAIYEDSLPLIIRDMLVADLDSTPGAEALLKLEADDINTASLPFEVRLEMMQAAAKHWTPRRFDGNHSDESWWHGPASAAREVLESHPEVFRLAPQHYGPQPPKDQERKTMTGSENAPTPWTVERAIWNDETGDVAYILEGAKRANAATARRIAAAPRMLRALQTINAIHRQGDIHTLSDYINSGEIGAIIAKATLPASPCRPA